MLSKCYASETRVYSQIFFYIHGKLKFIFNLSNRSDYMKT